MLPSSGASAAFEVSGFPNPFTNATTIRFELPSKGPVSVSVYDVAGRRVRVLSVGASLDAGFRAVLWDGRSDSGFAVPSGVYFVRVEAAHHASSGRLLKIR
jgi:flagellar hook assembly protein FlgD